jgi:hypothetical protein
MPLILASFLVFVESEVNKDPFQQAQALCNATNMSNLLARSASFSRSAAKWKAFEMGPFASLLRIGTADGSENNEDWLCSDVLSRKM